MKTLMSRAVPKDYEANQRFMRSQVLLEAAMLGQADRIRRVYKEDVDMEIKGPDGRTPLLKATALGHWNAVVALLETKVDLTARDNWGHTALKIAMQNRDEPIIRALREHGATE